MSDAMNMDVMTFEAGLAAAHRALTGGDVNTALWIWRQLQDGRSDRSEPFLRAAEVLTKFEHHQEADAVLVRAVAQLPPKPAVFIEYARAAEARNDWAEAARRWEEAQERFPTVRQIADGLVAARLRTPLVPEPAESPSPEAEPDTGALSDRDLVMQFESLGGAGHGCEFGLFQRHFEAEPLGLLRWADLGAELLAAALEARFEGVGEPENTEIFVPGEDEYWTRDKRYWMAMRSFVKTDDVPLDKMQQQVERRQSFLRRKLIGDLESNAKIFVFKDMWRVLPPELVARLHRAVRAYGGNSTLLYVRFADAAHPDGTVVIEKPGLMIGYIDHFAFSPEDKQLEFPMESWLAICRRAHELWPQANEGAGEEPEEEPLETAIERAQRAERERDWKAAREAWQAVRMRTPDLPAGHIGAARALRELGRFAEADAVLTEAAERLPQDSGIASERCWVVFAGRDYPEAAARWADFRARFPELSAGWIGGALALREMRQFEGADQLLREAIDRFPGETGPVFEHAWLAWARRDWVESAARWEIVRSRYPDRPEGYFRGALSLAEIWRYDEAEALLKEGIGRFPDDPMFAIEYAHMAMHQSRLDQAEERYAYVRRQFPTNAEGYLGEARVQRNQFHLDQAEEVLRQGMAALPLEPRLQFEHAMLPVFAPLKRDRDPDETLARLAALRDAFPAFETGYVAAIQLLREENRLDEAETIAVQGTKQLPASRVIAVERANIASDRNDLPEAIERFTDIRNRFPYDVAGPIGLGKALDLAGRRAEAEAVLRDAMARFPGMQASFLAHAEIAVHAEDWREALSRLLAAQSRFPDDKSFPQRISDVRLHLIGQEDEQAEADAGSSDSSDPRAEFRELIMQFESLGGRGIGCEFGMFQREFGAEPLGLLRWADMPYDGIIWVLENRFEGVGQPEHTEVFVNRENARPEYCTRDLRGFMFMRAFVYEDEMPFEKMEKQALRRLAFLKKKLISDLEAGEKIFVWRSTEQNLTDEELDRLHAAVRSYGRNVLFYVRYADDEHPLGTIEIRKPGLMVGYIDRFKMDRAGNLAATPASASWTMLCRKAHGLFAEALG